MLFKHKTLVIIALLALVVAGCRQQPDAAPDTAGITIALDAGAGTPQVGTTELSVTVLDAENKPVENATVNVRGDMTHAGMVPVIAETSTSAAGVYTLPFEWTMGGDWILTVQVTLADGTQTSQEFEYSVAMP